jgi:hypothetical protein
MKIKKEIMMMVSGKFFELEDYEKDCQGLCICAHG